MLPRRRQRQHEQAEEGGPPPQNWTPMQLFMDAQRGLWVDADDLSTMFQDSSGTVPVTTAGEPVGRILDKTTNGNHLIQATTSRKPLYQVIPNRLGFDRVDDVLDTLLPLEIIGTVVLANDKGLIHYEVNSYSLTTRFFNDISELVMRHGYLDAGELFELKNYLALEGVNDSYDFPADSSHYFFAYDATITKLYTDTWNTAAVTNFEGFIRDLDGLIEMDISTLNFNAATSMQNFALNSALQILTVGSAFNTTLCTNYALAFSGCDLIQQSVDDILVSINAAGTSNGQLGIHAGTNATPGAAGQAATDALRSRGWTVALNGY